VLVSVLMTSFQHERYVARALDGVLAQRAVPFELLVGDDASTDRTRDVIADYRRRHPDLIRTFFPDRNLGKDGKTIFNALIGLARGDYIAFLDGDDYWTSPEKLHLQMAHLYEHPECAMCFHNVLCVYEDAARPDEPYNDPRQGFEVGVPELLERCVVASCSPLFRREAIDPLPSWYFELRWGDWPLYFMAARVGEIHYLPEIMGVYRIHRAGLYRGLSRLETLEGRTAFYEGLKVPPEHDDARRAKLAETWVKLALENRRLGDHLRAARCLATGLRLRPQLLLTAPGAAMRRRRDMARNSRIAWRD
jgi:glycosyltransferase involved in cell wall biosynthesis